MKDRRRARECSHMMLEFCVMFVPSRICSSFSLEAGLHADKHPGFLIALGGDVVVYRLGNFGIAGQIPAGSDTQSPARGQRRLFFRYGIGGIKSPAHPAGLVERVRHERETPRSAPRGKEHRLGSE